MGIKCCNLSWIWYFRCDKDEKQNSLWLLSCKLWTRTKRSRRPILLTLGLSSRPSLLLLSSVVARSKHAKHVASNVSRGNYDVNDLNLRRWPWQTFLCTPVKHRTVLCHRKHLNYKMYFPVLYKVQNYANWKLYKIMEVVLFPWMSSSRRMVKKLSNMRDFIYDDQFKWKWIFSHCPGN